MTFSRPTDSANTSPRLDHAPSSAVSLCSNARNEWAEGAGRIPLRSVSGLYLIERLASPLGSFIAYFRPCLGTLTACGPVRGDIEDAKSDADGHLAGLREKAA